MWSACGVPRQLQLLLRGAEACLTDDRVSCLLAAAATKLCVTLLMLSLSTQGGH